MNPYKILIVEDDFTIQSELRILLTGNGYDVFAVTDFSKTIQQVFAHWSYNHGGLQLSNPLNLF